MNMKKILLVTALLLAVLLSACGQEVQPAQPPVVETEAPTEPPAVEIGGTTVDRKTAELDLSDGKYMLDMLLEAAPQLDALTRIDLGVTQLNAAQMEQLQGAFPNAEITYEVDLFGQRLSAQTEILDLSAVAAADLEAALEKLPLLTGLQQISFVSEEDVCAVTVADIPVLDKIREVLPEVAMKVKFELFGQTVTSEDERIEYFRVPIGNEGVETVRAVLPYLSSCTYLLMDGCDVDYEIMAQLREDFRSQTKVVWRVWVREPYYDSAKVLRWASFLTDTHRIRTVLVNDKNCGVLKYCEETKYVDFGHNYNISDFSFLGYMPKLEAAIIGLTNCNDISMLVNCPELEYLEVYGSKVTDLTPLASLKNLKHLNISRMEIDDITCLYDLDLERLRCVVTDVPKEQLEEYSRLHPDCQMLLDGYMPHKNGWRYEDSQETKKAPRYALLQEQMEYAIDAKYGIP